jgi:hypothetical protein
LSNAANADGTVLVGRFYNTHIFTFSYAVRNDVQLPFPVPCITQVHCDGEAFGVSADGNLSVGFTDVPGDRTRAVLWNARTNSVTTLSSQPEAKALAISGDGQVVVGYEVYDQANATRWADGTSNTVIDLLTAAGITMTGWTLTQAQGASRDGAVIVGEGINPQGQTEGWVAVLPR